MIQRNKKDTTFKMQALLVSNLIRMIVSFSLIIYSTKVFHVGLPSTISFCLFVFLIFIIVIVHFFTYRGEFISNKGHFVINVYKNLLGNMWLSISKDTENKKTRFYSVRSDMNITVNGMEINLTKNAKGDIILSLNKNLRHP